MNRVKRKIKTMLAVVMAMMMLVLPVCAGDFAVKSIEPYLGCVDSVALSMSFDTNNVVYCSLTATGLSNTSGISGVMQLHDSRGNVLKSWAVSDYEEPFSCEFTYQGRYWATYTLTFEGYAYSNNGTLPDRLELDVTGQCK